MKKTIVIILGMHRSGTSVLANYVRNLGVDFSDNLLPPQADNPEGFFENAGIVELNDSLLNRKGLSWHCLDKIGQETFNFEEKKEFIDKLDSIFKEEYGDGKVYGVKDPRICRLFHLWKPALDELGYEVNVLHVLRNPFEVACSLRDRDGFELEAGLALWVAYNCDARNYLKAYSSTTILYDDFIEMKESVFKGIQNHLPPLNKNAEIPVKKELRHHAFTLNDVPENVSKLYKYCNKIFKHMKQKNLFSDLFINYYVSRVVKRVNEC